MAGSVHFRRDEFACRHCGVVVLTPRLVDALERLRAIHGRPIVIVSGYRCPIRNEAVHGAPDSQHMYGTAADLVPGAATVAEAESVGFRGIGSRGSWATHVDMRDGPVARWSYGSG
jgi:uncharacterized protein YcbK (DUF882 family)